MNMQRKTMDGGLTGFWMRVGSDVSVRVVNGTMYRLLSAKKGFTLIHILSPHMHRTILRSVLYAKRKSRNADNRKSSYPKCYGLIGLKARSNARGWASNIVYPGWNLRRALHDMLLNISSNRPFSLLIGLPDGNDTIVRLKTSTKA